MSKRINITLNEPLYNEIKELATKENRSVSNMIQHALIKYIKDSGINFDTTRSNSNSSTSSYKRSTDGRPVNKKNIIGYEEGDNIIDDDNEKYDDIWM